MPLKNSLAQIFKGEILDDDQTLLHYSKDASIFEIKPQIVLFPKDSEDIKSLVNFVNKNPELSLNITPRAAGTCMSGGPINNSIILDMTKYFNKIIDLRDDAIISQPGVFYRDFEKETLKKNLILPSYTSSRELNTVGGMVGNNSAGEKTLAFGQTKDWTKRVKVILSDGNEYIFGPINKTELDKKMAQPDFEGKIYRQIFDLVNENLFLIKNSTPKVSKNSAGYQLWEVWDGENFDLSKLFVGSQGTLGIITEVEFKLAPVNNESAMLIIEMDDLEKLDQVVNSVLKYKPESFECFDDQTMKYAIRFLSKLTKKFKLNSMFSIYIQFLPEIIRFISGTTPKLFLMANFTGQSVAQAIHKCLASQEALADFKLNSKIRIAEATEKYWVIRRESFSLLKNHSSQKRTAPFIDDIIVRPEFLPQFLPRLKQILDPYKQSFSARLQHSDKKLITYTIAGHIGNGNFHIIPLMDLKDENVKKIIPELSEKVFNLVFEFGGSMAAEHNDGLVRGQYLDKMFGESIYQLFKEIKYIFDPKNIFNPHKKTDASFEYSLDLISHRQDFHHGS